MTYQEAVAYMESRQRVSSGEIGLARMRSLLARLGDPQDRLRFVHIAGSNGKGSTAAMCESVLRRAGYRTGLFISPYIYDFRERIQIGGALIGRETLAELVTELRPLLEEFEAAGDPIGAFEAVTALAFCAFARAGCEVVVLEVGIGGLLDSTNVIAPPLAAVICSLSLEHTELLGNTIPEIAEQKCGIIKPGSRVAAYAELPDEALPVLHEACARCGITPRIGAPERLRIERLSGEGAVFCYDGRRYRTPLAGRHQVMNALTVISVIEELRCAGLSIPQEALEQGIAEVYFPGRLETVRRSPLCIVDGAHNPAKIDSLCAALDELYPGRRIIGVVGMLAEKNHARCVPKLAGRCAVLYAVTPPSPRALSAQELAEEARPWCADVRVVPSAEEAARRAVAEAGADDLLLASGSMYLLNDARTGFLDRT